MLLCGPPLQQSHKNTMMPVKTEETGQASWKMCLQHRARIKCISSDSGRIFTDPLIFPVTLQTDSGQTDGAALKSLSGQLFAAQIPPNLQIDLRSNYALGLWTSEALGMNWQLDPPQSKQARLSKKGPCHRLRVPTKPQEPSRQEHPQQGPVTGLRGPVGLKPEKSG